MEARSARAGERLAAGVTLAVLAMGCGESAAVHFELTAARGGEARASAVIFAGDSPVREPVLDADPEADRPPPSWLDGDTVVRVNGVPLLREGETGFAATLSTFAFDTPVSFEVIDDGHVVLFTPPVQADSLEVLGPPASAARSASQDLTVTFDRDASGSVIVAVVEPTTGAVAFTGDATGVMTSRTIPASSLAALRSEALAAGVAEGPEGLPVELDVRFMLAARGCLSESVSAETCTLFMNAQIERRPLFLVP